MRDTPNFFFETAFLFLASIIFNMSLLDLPDPILEREIYCKYLTKEDQKIFLGTSKQWHEIKRRTSKYSLNNKYSKLFCVNPEFREQVYSCIIDPRYQLSINLSFFDYESHSRNIRELRLQQSLKQLSSLYNVLLSRNSLVTELSSFQNFHLLDISNCYKIRNPNDQLTKLRDIQILNISGLRNLTEIRSLNNINSVVAYGLSNLKEIKNVGNLSSIMLGDCQSLRSVKGLQHVTDVKISDCPHITDLFTLSNVKSLRFSGELPSTPSFLNFPEVEELQIRNKLQIKDISKLQKVKILDIYGCRNIENLECLPCLEKVTVCECMKKLIVSDKLEQIVKVEECNHEYLEMIFLIFQDIFPNFL
jgi:hypothetical protein